MRIGIHTGYILSGNMISHLDEENYFNSGVSNLEDASPRGTRRIAKVSDIANVMFGKESSPITLTVLTNCPSVVHANRWTIKKSVYFFSSSLTFEYLVVYREVKRL